MSRAKHRVRCDAIIARLARFLAKLTHHLQDSKTVDETPARSRPNLRFITFYFYLLSLEYPQALSSSI